MNKSKFLKKSLAMLLALMLVVAMIPLSAAAAQQPAISQAWVSDGSKARLDISGSDITGSISESARSFDLEFMVSGDVTAFYYYDQSQSNAPQKKVDLKGSTATIPDLNVLDYEDESGNIVVRVSAANSVGTANYTVTLTPAAVSVNTDIDTLYVGVVTGSSEVPTPQLGPTTFDGTTIKVTVPYVDSGDTNYKYIIQTLDLASETAVAKYIDKNGADQGVIVPGETKVEDGGTISVTNNGQTKNYPLEITVAYGVTSLSFKEAVDTIVFPDDEKIAVLLPYGYTSTASNNITVTPEFELDYPSATATWNGVSVVDLESGEEIKVANNKVQSTGDSDAAFWRYGYTAGNTDSEATSWTYRKANYSDEWYNTTKGFMRTGKVNTAVVDTMGEGGTFTIHYSDTTDRSYEVYFFETRYNSAATIESLTIGSETATIDQDAKTIDITLPAGTNAANLQLDDLETKLTIKASDNATLSVPKTSANPSVVISKDPNKGSRNLTNDFTSSSKLDASDEVIVRIASQDGLTVNDYRLNVTVASDYVAPQLTDVALQSPNGTNFEPVEEKADGTIVFEVPYTSGVAPYGPTERDDLNGWKFFYTKTVGSSATYKHDGKTTAMPLTGSKMVINAAGDSCDYIPTVADGTTGAIITVSAKASNGSIATKEYKIQINRVDPDDNSVLTSFDLGAYGTDYTYFTETFKGSVKTDEGNKSGEIVVELPWSLYQDTTLLEDLSAMAKSANDKEKIFVDNGDGKLREIGQVTETVDGSIFPSRDIYNQPTADDPLNALTANGHDKTKVSTEGDTPIKLVVLSERAWANMEWDPESGGYYANNWKGQIDGITGDDLNLYTEYKVWINQADPKEEATLSNMVLIDGSGWQANLNIDVDGKKISGNIPYALTSDLDADGNPVNRNDVNPIYLDYTISPRAFLLAADTKGNPIVTNKNPKPTANVDDKTKIPVSGQTKDVRFANINDYDKFSDYYNAHKAYLLISRDGDVYVYQDGNKVADVTSNQLAATNEDGKKVYNVFNVDLRVNEPNTGAEFSSFALNGYTGTIDQEKDTITVTLPFGTEYTYLTPTYNVSEGATVYVDDPELYDTALFSGKYQVNFTAPRHFTVISESENVTTTYTVNVVVSDEFSDVKPGDWFYNNVMDAVANGYMAGEGNGIFNPMGKSTRAVFACTIANALGYEAPEDTTTVTTRFKDVPSTHWGAGAIAFCVENEIIGGYDDGTFRPDQAITRQEAAAILNNAFDLTASTDVSKFTDANRIASWATAHVAAVANAELMNGDVDGAFRPTSTLTRAELASIMMNAKNHGYID